MAKEYERCFRVSTLLDEFQKYLKTVLGVSKGTIDTQLYHVTKYLKFQSNNEFITIAAISSLNISNYLIDLNDHVKPKTTQNIASSLKSFLRFLFIKGFIKSDETMMIPKFSCWKLSKVPHRASYIFRHTLAGKMLLKGASIKEIADVLRHKSLDTTMIYTKINFPELNDVIMSWPEVIG